MLSTIGSNVSGSLSKIDDTTKQVTQSTNSMGDAYASTGDQISQIDSKYLKVADSTDKVDASTKKSSLSMTQQVGAVNQLASSGVILALSFDGIEKATLASDKANLNVQRSTEKLDQAQKSLTETTLKYGAGSDEAKDAQDKLAIAEEAHTISVERQQIVSQDLNQTYMQTAVSIIPAVIGVVTSLSTVKGILTGLMGGEAAAEGVSTAAKIFALGPIGALTAASAALNAVLLANPIILVVVAIAALVAALILAYNYCTPFKDAVDALGKALGEGLGRAVEVIKGALEWLWNNVLVPLGEFLVGSFMGAINFIGEKLAWLTGPVKAVGDAFGWVAGIIGGAINAVGAKIEEYNGMVKAAEESTKNGLSVMANYYTDKYAAMSQTVDDELSKQLDSINKSYADGVAAQATAYKTDMDAFVKSWTDKYTVTETELTKLTAVVTKYYDDQIKEVQDSTKAMEDYLRSAYAKELTDYTDSYTKKYGVVTTELDKVQGVITTHYDNEIAALQTVYNDQIAAVNTLYDGLLTATNAGLVALRGAHQQSNDDNELLMLEQKVSLEQAYAAGLIDVTTYNTQVNDLTKAYNTQRGVDQDAFRLEELRLERAAKAAGITIEEERALELSGIAEKEKIDITGINAEKYAVLEAAAAEYHQIAHDDMMTLTAAITALKQDESDQVTAIDTKKHAALDTLSKDFNKLEQGNANELLRLQTEKANAIHDAEVASSQKKRDALDSLEKEINADVRLSESEKVAIVQRANDDIQINTATSWGLIAGTIHASIADINANLVTLGASVATANAAAAGVQSAQAAVTAGYSASKQATINQLNAQLAVFEAAISSGQYSRSDVQSSIDATQRQLTAAQAMASGGIVYEPTLALIGEAGPEAVIPLSNLARNMGGSAGQDFAGQTKQQQITFAPGSVTISIANVSSDADLAQIPRLVSEGVAEAYRRLNY